MFPVVYCRMGISCFLLWDTHIFRFLLWDTHISSHATFYEDSVLSLPCCEVFLFPVALCEVKA